MRLVDGHLKRGLTAILRAIAPIMWVSGALAQTIPDASPDLVDQWTGSDDAAVTVVAYVSLNCPHCARFHSDDLPAIRSKYIDTGKVRLAIRDFPTNATATQAAMLAWCSGGRREHMMTELYADFRQWAFDTKSDRLIESAAKAGMDREEIARCLGDQRLSAAMQKGKELAYGSSHADTVPFFFVNGVKYQDSLPPDAIDKALAMPPPYEQSKRWCLQDNASPGATIRACAALVAAAREPPDVMARVHVHRGWAFLERKDIDRAMDEFTAAIPLDPKGADALWRRGMLKIGKRDIPGAMEDLDRALRINPNSSDAYYGRGLAYKEQKDYAKAIAAFDQALRLDPKYADVLIERSKAYEALQQPARALADLDQALRVEPGNTKALHGRAVVYTNEQQFDKAFADLAEALRKDPRMTAAYALRVMIRESQGQFAEAIRDLDSILSLDPNRPEWLNERCWDKAIVGQSESALADCDAAIRLAPSEPSYLDSRGFAHLKAKQYDAAIADYDAALKLAPGMAPSLFGRGVAKRAKGDTAGGEQDLAAARTASATIDQDMAHAGVTP